MNTINHILEQQRQRYLDWLYAESGRTNGLYTGLYQARKQELIDHDMEHVLLTEPL